MVSQLEVSGALLFVPGDRPDRFDKAAATGADHVILDLEDAVDESSKGAARQAATTWLSAGGKAVVRINGLDTRHHGDDLRAVGPLARAILLPKAEDPRTVEAVVRSSPTQVLALIETPAGLLDVAAIASTGVAALLFGNVDFAACLGVDPASHPALLTARSTVVYASAAAGLTPPIDGVTTALRSPQILDADLIQSRDLGFAGKLCIHPDQVAPTQRAFAPTDDEVRWADAVIRATDSPHSSTAAGVVAVEGQMVDLPVLQRARAILRSSRRGEKSR